MSAPLLYSSAEAAVLLGVTKNWLDDQVKAHAIPHRRLGRYIRFSQDDLDLLIEQSAKKPVSNPVKRPA